VIDKPPGRRTDDNLWRPTRRAKGRYTKDKLSTRRGAVHSIGWLSRTPDRGDIVLVDHMVLVFENEFAPGIIRRIQND